MLLLSLSRRVLLLPRITVKRRLSNDFKGNEQYSRLELIENVDSLAGLSGWRSDVEDGGELAAATADLGDTDLTSVDDRDDKPARVSAVLLDAKFNNNIN